MYAVGLRIPPPAIPDRGALREKTNSLELAEVFAYQDNTFERLFSAKPKKKK